LLSNGNPVRDGLDGFIDIGCCIVVVVAVVVDVKIGFRFETDFSFFRFIESGV